MGIGLGYGKTILFGEHFVVYGLPAIASAIGASTTAEVKVSKGSGWVVNDNRPATPGYKKKKHDAAIQSINNVINHLQIDIENNRLEISFGGNLIATSGVGASAAQCTSLARALNDTFNLKLDDEKINKAAYQGEKAYHGIPSGIDNTVSTYGGLIWFIKSQTGEKNIMEHIKIPKKMLLVMADSGITSSTKEVVSDVRQKKEKEPERFEKIFLKYGKLAKEARRSLIEGDISKIGFLMNQNHSMLQQISVSGKVNDQLVRIALKNGGLGAKMTGTGRGGLVICLAEDEENQKRISSSIEKEGYITWKTTIG